MEKRAFKVPETAKTRKAAGLPATTTTAANPARTTGKDTKLHRTTATLRSTSKLINTNPDKEAPTSP
ncbi:MAG: hypothetical protein NWE92_06485 [Candidatus Bathyarchaeota archaeon]|nr:hypothetical protein [Candidatus Bathyarchaeota archaeon]